MENLYLWENLEPIDFADAQVSIDFNPTSFKLLESVATSDITASRYLLLQSSQIEEIKKLHLNLYNLPHGDTRAQETFIQNLPSDERKTLVNFRNISSHLTLLEEVEKIKINFQSIGKNELSEKILKVF